MEHVFWKYFSNVLFIYLGLNEEKMTLAPVLMTERNINLTIFLSLT